MTPELPSDDHVLGPALYGALVERLAGRRTTAEPGWLVVLAGRQTMPDERRLTAFADAMRTDVYTARQWMLCPAPRVLRRYPSERKAREWAVWLTQLRISAFALAESELAAGECHHAAALTFGAGSITLATPDGATHRLDPGTVIALVAATLTEEFRAEESARAPHGGDLDAGRELLNRFDLPVIDIHSAGAGAWWRLVIGQVRLGGLGEPAHTGVSMAAHVLAALRARCPAATIHQDFPAFSWPVVAPPEVLSSDTILRRVHLRGLHGLRIESRRVVRVSNESALGVYTRLAAAGERALRQT